MRRASTKKVTERRKKARSVAKAKAPSTSTQARAHAARTNRIERAHATNAAQANEETCQNCSKALANQDRALFVEEEVGRIFCSESCIASFFTPEIDRLEKEYHRRLSNRDLTASERESLNHLRWITLQEPDEVWREKTLTGDYRYVLISEFQPSNKKVWCVCICLFLRGEPSFLYLAFPTRNEAMANQYRRGERVQWAPTQKTPHPHAQAHGQPSEEAVAKSDRLADGWSEDETFMAQINQERRDDDIPPGEFSLYQSCLEETLETPDEVWSFRLGQSQAEIDADSESKDDETAPRHYHFIRFYPDEDPGVWFVIVAREADDDPEQIEILDAFPTRDPALVSRYRRGEQEIGQTQSGPASRVVH